MLIVTILLALLLFALALLKFRKSGTHIGIAKVKIELVDQKVQDGTLTYVFKHIGRYSVNGREHKLHVTSDSVIINNRCILWYKKDNPDECCTVKFSPILSLSKLAACVSTLVLWFDLLRFAMKVSGAI